MSKNEKFTNNLYTSLEKSPHFDTETASKL